MGKEFEDKYGCDPDSHDWRQQLREHNRHLSWLRNEFTKYERLLADVFDRLELDGTQVAIFDLGCAFGVLGETALSKGASYLGIDTLDYSHDPVHKKLRDNLIQAGRSNILYNTDLSERESLDRAIEHSIVLGVYRPHEQVPMFFIGNPDVRAESRRAGWVSTFINVFEVAVAQDIPCVITTSNPVSGNLIVEAMGGALERVSGIDSGEFAKALSLETESDTPESIPELKIDIGGWSIELIDNQYDEWRIESGGEYLRQRDRFMYIMERH